jgi:ribosomal protein L11 methyltransferase
MSTSYELSLTLAQAQAEICSDALNVISQAVAITDCGESWLVEAWFEDEPDADIVEALLIETLGEPALDFSVTRIQEEDWVARSLEGLTPVRAGLFAVHGRHDRGAYPANVTSVEIEAGLAFGTGHHGTTSGCLIALTNILKHSKPRSVLDLGTGTGVLAIAAAKRLKTGITASDIDPVAVGVAAENARLNGVHGWVRPVTASGLHHRKLMANAPYELILANILARPLVGLAPSICRNLAKGGRLVLSGLLEGQIALVLGAYRGQGLVLESKIIREGWATLMLRG